MDSTHGSNPSSVKNRRTFISAAGDYALVQPSYRAQRRQDRSLLPGIHERTVFARQDRTAVDRTKILVVLLARIVFPHPIAAKRPWDAVPGYRNAIVEFRAHLRVQLRTIFEHALQPLGR